MKYLFISLIFFSAVVLAVVFSKRPMDKGNEDQMVSELPPVVVEKIPKAASRTPKVLDKPSAVVPESPEVPISELLKNGQTEAVIARLEELLRTDPTNKDALLTLAGLYSKDSGRRDKAEQLLRKAIESDPENREALEKYLDLQHDSQRPGSPLESLRRLTEENSDSPGIAGAYARSLADKGLYAEAIALLERAIENPKADALAFTSLAEYYRKTGQSGRAAEAFERAEALIRAIEAKSPNHPLLKGLRGQLERARNS